MRYQIIEIPMHLCPGSGHRKCKGPEDVACLSFSMTARRSGYLGQSKPRGGKEKQIRSKRQPEALLCRVMDVIVMTLVFILNDVEPQRVLGKVCKFNDQLDLVDTHTHSMCHSKRLTSVMHDVSLRLNKKQINTSQKTVEIYINKKVEMLTHF